MQSVLFFLRGAFRGHLRVQAILRGYELRSELRIARGWKPFMLLPRLLLFRLRKGGKVPKKALEECFQFQEGRWLELAFCCGAKSISFPSDAAAIRGKTMEFRGAWTGRTSWCIWESCLQPMATLRELTNPARRPFVARHALSQEILQSGFPHVFEDRQKMQQVRLA